MKYLPLAESANIVESGIILIITTFKALQAPAQRMVLLYNANTLTMSCQNICTFKAPKSAPYYKCIKFSHKQTRPWSNTVGKSPSRTAFSPPKMQILKKIKPEQYKRPPYAL